MNLRKALATAIRSARKRKHLTQEDFAIVSSRTYLSALERGLKSPTLDKLDEIAQTMGIHPAVLVLAAYGVMTAQDDTQVSLDAILAEAKQLVTDMQSLNEG